MKKSKKILRKFQLIETLAKINWSGAQARTLLFLLSKLDLEKFRKVKQRSIVEATGLKKGTVSKVVQSLLDEGLLERDSEHPKHFRFSEDFLLRYEDYDEDDEDDEEDFEEEAESDD